MAHASAHLRCDGPPGRRHIRHRDRLPLRVGDDQQLRRHLPARYGPHTRLLPFGIRWSALTPRHGRFVLVARELRHWPGEEKRTDSTFSGRAAARSFRISTKRYPVVGWCSSPATIRHTLTLTATGRRQPDGRPR